jgi:hypothetical protein
VISDVAEALQHFVNSPPGHLAAGGVLFGIVTKFFREVEERLNEDTKLEVAVWLLGLKAGEGVERWPGTFARVFDRVFGAEHVSWRCFVRSALATTATLILATVVWCLIVAPELFSLKTMWQILRIQIPLNVVPDYISLLIARRLIRSGPATPRVRALHLLLGSFLSVGIAVGCGWAGARLDERFNGAGENFFDEILRGIVVAAGSMSASLFTSIWLWLYLGSGLILKAAHRFNAGMGWFNRHLEIERKPLSCIGLVAGALVALLYWGVAGGMCLVKGG